MRPTRSFFECHSGTRYTPRSADATTRGRYNRQDTTGMTSTGRYGSWQGTCRGTPNEYQKGLARWDRSAIAGADSHRATTTTPGHAWQYSPGGGYAESDRSECSSNGDDSTDSYTDEEEIKELCLSRDKQEQSREHEAQASRSQLEYPEDEHKQEEKRVLLDAKEEHQPDHSA